MSTNFGDVDLDHLTFPTTMSVDYVRVYQDPNNKNVGCDPQDFPTQSYINQSVIYFSINKFCLLNFCSRYIEAYSNPNLTTWEDDFKQTRIKSSYLGDC